jgi:hypothetical protein
MTQYDFLLILQRHFGGRCGAICCMMGLRVGEVGKVGWEDEGEKKIKKSVFERETLLLSLFFLCECID